MQEGAARHEQRTWYTWETKFAVDRAYMGRTTSQWGGSRRMWALKGIKGQTRWQRWGRLRRGGTMSRKEFCDSRKKQEEEITG